MSKKSKGQVALDEVAEAKRKRRSLKKDLIRPECLGQYKDCTHARCKHKQECKAIQDRNEEERRIKENDKQRKKEISREKMHFRINSIKAFFRRLFTIHYWVSFIQSFEELAEVVFIDLMLIILLASVGFSIYFLYKGNWIMNLCSIATFIAIGVILERMGNTKSQSKGDQN